MISVKIAANVVGGVLGAVTAYAIVKKGIRDAKKIKESYEAEKKDIVDDYITYVDPDISVEEADKIVRTDLKKIIILSGIVSFVTSICGSVLDSTSAITIRSGVTAFMISYFLDIFLTLLNTFFIDDNSLYKKCRDYN